MKRSFASGKIALKYTFNISEIPNYIIWFWVIKIKNIIPTDKININI